MVARKREGLVVTIEAGGEGDGGARVADEGSCCPHLLGGC